MAPRADNETVKQLHANTDSITIESIVDLDVISALDSTAVQFKYLSKSRLINLTVRKTIYLMLDHFANSTTPYNLKYSLHTHFGIETVGNEMTIDLVDKHNSNDIAFPTEWKKYWSAIKYEELIKKIKK